MARKIINRKELRRENDAAEERDEDEGEEKVAKPKKAKAAAGAKKPARKSRAKTAKVVRLKAFWGVFNQSMKRVALYEYSQRADADKKVSELNGSQKTPHFVQLVKEAITE